MVLLNCGEEKGDEEQEERCLYCDGRHANARELMRSCVLGRHLAGLLRGRKSMLRMRRWRGRGRVREDGQRGDEF